MKLRTKTIVVTTILWILGTGFLIAWNIRSYNNTIIQSSIHEAASSIERDIAFRKLLTVWGGVYVSTDKVEPNKYLEIQNRDITSQEVGPLTLINPAYFNRLCQQMFPETISHQVHLTSVKRQL